MEKPLVSVVVVSYDHAKYIRENLDSINAQTYQNIELIVADDASQDNSVEVFEQWLSENNYPAKKNFHKKNTGLATMLNECTEMLTGKYVKFIAADDFLHEQYISKCVDILENNNAHIAFAQAYSINDHSEIISKNYFPIPENATEDMGRKLCEGNYIPGSTLFFRSQIVQTIGAYDKKLLLEDYDFALRAFSKNLKFVFINENLIFYRNHSTNISKMKLVELETETEKLKLKYFRDKKYAIIINSSISKKIDLYGKPFARNIIRHFLTYPYFSKGLLFRLLKAII